MTGLVQWQSQRGLGAKAILSDRVQVPGDGSHRAGQGDTISSLGPVGLESASSQGLDLAMITQERVGPGCLGGSVVGA